MIRKKYAKNMAAAMAAAMMLTAVEPAMLSASAAAAPANGTNLSTIYYGKSTTYKKTIKNVKKGYVVKFSTKGDGKSYISFTSGKVTAKGTTVGTTVKVKKSSVTDNAGKKKATIVAKVYTKSGKLVKMVNDNVTIAQDATKVAIKTTKMDLTDLVAGGDYDFDRTLTPSNSSNKTYWTVENASGEDCSSLISSQGVFHPTEAGTYVITATARRSKNGLARATKSLTVKVNEAEARVIGVTPQNASTVLVKFSEKVSKVSAENIDNYSIGGVKPLRAVLGTDGKSVTLTFTSAEYTNKVFVAEPITTEADSKVLTSLYSSVYSYTDKTAPKVETVEAVTAGTAASGLTITADEPIAGGVVKVDGTAVSGTWTDQVFTATGLNLAASSKHTLQVVNLKDKSAAGNTTPLTTLDFTVKVDNVAPTASLSMENDTAVKVTFSKKMNPDTVLAVLGAAGSVTDTSSNVINCTAEVVAGSDNREFTLKIEDSNFYGSASGRTILVKFTDAVTDYLGNKMAAVTTSLTMVKDTKAPVFTSVTAVKNKDTGKVESIVVTADKSLVKVADQYPTIVRNDGVSYSYDTFLGGLTAPVVSGNKITYTLKTPSDATGIYTLTFPAGFVKDTTLGANANASQTLALDLGSASVSATFKVVSVDASTKNVIDVTFDSAVVGGSVANSATDPANYSLNGSALPSGTTIVLTDSAKKTARITLPASGIGKSDDKAILIISGIANANGAVLETYTTTVAVYDNVAPTLTSAKFNAIDAGKSATVRLTYSENIRIGDNMDQAADEFALIMGSQNIKASSISKVAGSDNMLDVVFETEASVTGASIKTTGNSIVKDTEGNAQSLNITAAVNTL